MRHKLSSLARSSRRGATLTEVLMTLLIMGLGITSVFTLFPMSILRSVKATRDTNGMLTAQNAREITLANPSITDPPNNTFVGTYVVDPYGVSQAGTFGNPAAAFGQVTRLRGDLDPDTMNVIPLTTSDVSSTDSWVDVVEEIPTAIDNNVSVMGGMPAVTRTVSEITFPDFVDLDELTGGQARVVVTSLDGTSSVSSPVLDLLPAVTYPAPNRVRLDGLLPGHLNSLNEIGQVRVETYERRYTWMLSVDIDAAGNRYVKCVVFFRRGFGEAETTHALEAGAIDFTNRKIEVRNAVGLKIDAGDYLFGTVQIAAGISRYRGKWMRVLAKEVSQTNTGNIILTLDQEWHGPDNDTNTDNEVDGARVMFPQGVVGAYDL